MVQGQGSGFEGVWLRVEGSGGLGGSGGWWG